MELVFWFRRNLIFVLLIDFDENTITEDASDSIENVEEIPYIKQLDLNTNHDSCHLETPTYEDRVT